MKENIPQIRIPKVGEKIDIDGHSFEVFSVDTKYEENKIIVDCLIISPLISMTLKLKSSYPVFDTELEKTRNG